MAAATEYGIDETAESRFELAFLPLHKRAFGVAAGTALSLMVLLATLIQIARGGGGMPLVLLAEFFYGYTVTVHGALVGAAWGFATGFVLGWFFAFCRNFAIALTMFIARTRAELNQVRDFLDHI
jgi:hypothetical protein